MAAADQIVFRYPRDRINERSSLTVIARFRDRATDADVVPTSVKYRIDCLNNGVEVQDWTAVAAAAEVSIVTTPENNKCVTRDELQRSLLTVAADFELSTQFAQCIEYRIRNLWLVQP